MQRAVVEKGWDYVIGAATPGAPDRARAGAAITLEMNAGVASSGQADGASVHGVPLIIDPFAMAEAASSSEPPPRLVNDMAGMQRIALRRRSFMFGLWIVTSLALHAMPVAAFMFWPVSRMEFGASTVETDAVSVELVSSNVLEALHMEEAEDAAAQQAVVMPEGNASFDNAAALNAEEKPVEAEEQPPVKPEPVLHQEETAPDVPAPIKVEKTEAVTEQTAVATPEEKLEQPEKTEPEKTVEVEENKEKEKESTPAPAARKGGVSVEAVQGSVAKARVSASTGELQNYGSKLRAHIVRHKVTGPAMRGTAVVSFAVTKSGELSYAKIATSSGRTALDERALATIRRSSPFPTPPANASPSQLRFVMPFYFQ